MRRRHFIAAAGATLAAVACGGGSKDDNSGSSSRQRRRHPRLTQRGMNYDTGIAYFPALSATALTRSVWRSEYVAREIDFITDDLHCNAVLVHGSDPDRLLEAARIGAERQLFVWIEPQLPDLDHPTTVAYLGEIAGAVEALRAQHPDIGMGLGCELSLFMKGIVPGETWQERYEVFMGGQLPDYDTPLNAFLGEAAATIRRSFGGQLTYSSGPWEQVDWDMMDVVGVDLYRDADNAATYEQEVRALRDHGKPAIITEFGACAYAGATDSGGDAWAVVEEGADPPVPAGLVRDEQEQAGYIDELLTVFEAEKLHGAFVYNFIEPESPHDPDDPRYDVDMTGYSVVKCYPDGHDRGYTATGDFEPKAACATIAAHYR